MLTSIHFNTDNQDCGENMESIEGKLRTRLFFSGNIFLCAGFHNGKTPIKDIKIFISENGKKPIPTDCRIQKIRGDLYLCIYMQDRAPKKIELSDFKQEKIENATHNDFGKPVVLAEIHNNNIYGSTESKIKRVFSYSKTK